MCLCDFRFVLFRIVPSHLTVNRIRASVVAPLVADALSLSTHYEYDAIKIKKFYGVVDQYYSPGEKTGGQTHGIGWGQRNYHGGTTFPLCIGQFLRKYAFFPVCR